MFAARASNLRVLREAASALVNAEKMLETASKVGAELTISLVLKGFKSGTDPYGSAWNAPNNLQITGGIRSYSRSYTARGWEVHSTDEKAIWHHDPQPRPAWGGKSLPTRLQVPTASRGLPDAWAKAIKSVIEASIASQMRRAMGG
jgi:hypothetical protein